jgi:hypothetical protein
MRNLWARSTHALARFLDAEEREMVLGDLTELSVAGRQAFQGIFGLVLRRQLGLWKQWESWFVLVAIVVPIGPLLAAQSNRLELTFFPNLVMWLHFGISYRTGVSSPALFAQVCLQAGALVTWSWSSTYALGALSRGTAWTNGVLLLLLFGVFIVHGRGYFIPLLLMTSMAWIPLSGYVLLVLLPAFWGLSKGRKAPRAASPWLVFLALWTLSIGGIAIWTQGWYGAALENWSHAAPPLTFLQLVQRADLWEIVLTHLSTLTLLNAPIVYLIAIRRLEPEAKL